MQIADINVGQRLKVQKHLFDGRGGQLLWRGQIVEVENVHQSGQGIDVKVVSGKDLTC